MRYANEQRNQWFEVMRLCCFQAFCSILDEKIHHCQGSELGICFLSKVLVRIILESSVCVQTAAKNFSDLLHKINAENPQDLNNYIFGRFISMLHKN